jgi:hypothetical protein
MADDDPVIDAKPVGDARPGSSQVYRWDWSRDDRRPQVPWIGVFLLVFGALLLLERAVPPYHVLGNVALLAAGISFLVVWAIRQSPFSLYAGALLTAGAIPGVLSALDYPVGGGVGSVAYGIAFLFIAAVRGARGGGWGWQLVLGVVLVALGTSEMVLPNLADLAFPLLLVVLGVVLLTRSRR